MGYYASYSGTIDFIRMPSEEEKDLLFKRLSESFDNCVVMGCDSPNGCSAPSFYADFSGDDKYYEDDVVQCLMDISEMVPVKTGEVLYDGEDGCHWRFIYDNGTWYEETGVILYDNGLSYDDIKNAFEKYLMYDLEDAESSHIKYILEDVCELSRYQIGILGYDWIYDM